MINKYLEKLAESASGIEIKPSHAGRLHENLGVSKGTKLTEEQIMAAKRSPDPAVRKRATFALNARKWKHSKTAEESDLHIAEKSKGEEDKAIHDYTVRLSESENPVLRKAIEHALKEEKTHSHLFGSAIKDIKKEI